MGLDAPLKEARLGAVSCATGAACVAIGTYGNGVGAFATALTTVRPVTTPGAPVDVLGVPRVRAAAISWAPPINDGGAPVTSFVATVEPGGAGCTTTTSRCSVGGLVDGRQYVVVVSAANSAGRGALGEARFIDGGPPTEPTGLHVVAWQRAIVALSWRASIPPPGMRVTDYDVSIYSGRRLVRNAVTHETACRLRGLVAHHRYTLAVSANDLSGGSVRATIHVIAP